MGGYVIQAPDGKVIQFPQGMDEQAINRAMGEMYPVSPQAQATAQTGSFVPNVPAPPNPILAHPDTQLAPGVPSSAATTLGVRAAEFGEGAGRAALKALNPASGLIDAYQQYKNPRTASFAELAGVNEKELGQAAEQGNVPGMIAETAIPLATALIGGAKARPMLAEAEAGAREAIASSELARRAAQGTLNAGAATTAEAVADANKSNLAAAAEHQKAVGIVEEMNNARHETAGQKAQLTADITSNGAKLASEVKNLEKTVRAQAGAKFEAISKAIGDAPANNDAIRAAVKHAETNILKGSPENIKLFKSLLSDTAAEGANGLQTSMGEIKPDHPLYSQLQQRGIIGGSEPIKFPDLQGYYSELGGKMSHGGLPGDVWQALKYVKEQGVGAEMNRLAEQHGVAPALQEARASWRKYETTFNDMRPLSQGGSPVARIFRAADPDYATAQLMTGAGTRGINMLGEYSPELASVAKETVAKYNQSKAIGKIGADKPLPPAPELKTVDPQELKRAAIEKIANSARSNGKFGIASDFAALASGHLLYPIGRRLAGVALERPSIMDWLSRPTSRDAAMMEGLGKNLTSPQQVMRAAKEGKITIEQARRLEQRFGRNATITRPIAP